MRPSRFLKMLLFFLVMVSALPFICSCRSGSQNKGDDAHQESVAEPDRMPVASFEKTFHDFGRVFSGEIVTYAFKVTNTGSAPLIILGAYSGCVCTVGDFTREPLPPGGEGRVRVRFDSAGRRGFMTETIRVVTNAEPQEQLLHIKVEVVAQ